MKKLFVTMCAIMLSVTAFAQMQSGGFHLDRRTTFFGIRLGFNTSTIGGDFDSNSRTGLNLGFVAGLKCSPSIPLFLESGLYYESKGGKKVTVHDVPAFTKVGMDYLEIPILMKYGIPCTDDLAVLPFVGPTFAVGVAGKVKPGKYDTFHSDRFSRFDMGIKLGCGVEWNMIYAELGYHFGLANVSDIEDVDAHNGSFFMNLGINF